MIDVTVDESIDAKARDRLLRELGLAVCAPSTQSQAAKVLVTTRAQMLTVRNAGEEASSLDICVIVLMPDPTVDEYRHLISLGAGGVIDEATPAQNQAVAILSIANGTASVPLRVLRPLATQLATPPPALTPEDVALLKLLTTRSIESAGFDFGLSRRQTQRRFKKLCDRFGFANHFEAIVAATRWGFAADH